MVAGYIFKAEWRMHWADFWGDSKSRAWDNRNGIIRNAGIERAFDSGRITIYEKDSVLRFHVLDPHLRNEDRRVDGAGEISWPCSRDRWGYDICRH
jgi:hypothetical protein